MMPTPQPSSTALAATAVPAVPVGAGHRLQALTEDWLDTILSIESQAYSHPWTRGNFVDALRSGYHAQMLLQGDEVLGYCIAMQVLDEVHVLNIAIAPAHQGQGLGRELLACLTHWCRYTAHAHWLWLEVRESNLRARQVYARHGLTAVGVRKNYYPAHHGTRENAVLMSMSLWP